MHLLDGKENQVSDTLGILSTCLVVMLGQNIQDANERIADLTSTGRCDRIDCSSKAKVELYIKHWHKSAKRNNVVWGSAGRRRAL